MQSLQATNLFCKSEQLIGGMRHMLLYSPDLWNFKGLTEWNQVPTIEGLTKQVLSLTSCQFWSRRGVFDEVLGSAHLALDCLMIVMEATADVTSPSLRSLCYRSSVNCCAPNVQHGLDMLG